MTACKKT